MKIGYTRASTKDQSLSMQIDALKQADCIQIHQEIASGTKTDRPVLDEIIRNLGLSTRLIAPFTVITAHIVVALH